MHKRQCWVKLQQCRVPSSRAQNELTWLAAWFVPLRGHGMGLSRRLLLLLDPFRQHIHSSFQQPALFWIPVAQVVPLKALVFTVEVVRNAAEVVQKSSSHCTAAFMMRNNSVLLAEQP